MPTALAVYDKEIGGNKKEAITLHLVSEKITVRELIEARVKEEVDKFNNKPSEYFRGLIQPTNAEKTLNGYKLKKRRMIDREEQSRLALDAFEKNGFFILVDDKQVEHLDDEIIVTGETQVGFIKLTPLVGG